MPKPGLLELNDIGCGGSLGAIHNVEGYPCAFLQRFEALGLNCGMMYEYILAAILLNKTKTLRIIKPFNCAFCHLVLLLCARFHVRTTLL